MQIVLATIISGVLIALAMAPVAGVAGAAAHRANATMESNIADLTTGWAPGVTTVTDSTGETMAHLYRQRRHPVEFEQISQPMKDAIIAIEDHRFYEHDGVDIQGTFRALVTNLLAGGVEQGASTLNQQYVKNYLLHVVADDAEAQSEATEQSVARKLREMRMATELDRTLSKDEILTRYLNLVPFGNHSYGVEAAARTYFGISAAELSVPQAAMLAGMVQSSEYLNPYTNYEGALERRNVVLQSMVSYGALDQQAADFHASEPLGILEEPSLLPNGCLPSGNRGFFCDYVVDYLQAKGLEEDHIYEGGLHITTTLDPVVQDAAHDTVTSMVNPTQPGVAEVVNVVEPGHDSRNILAMTSSRNYGLDLEAGETYLPQPSTLVGNGAGSVFKVFTAAAAMEDGTGLDTMLPVPTRYDAQGLGSGGAPGCPSNHYCVQNAGTYAPNMTLEDALAHSPNTTFIILTEQVGVEAIVDMAVKLGLRSYTEPGSYNEEYSIADYFKEANLGSFTLGPTAVNPLELSNVGATLASSGRWCEPNPVVSVLSAEGEEVALDRPDCEQVLAPSLADALSEAMASDIEYGTASRAANETGFSGVSAAKTGTTESNQSSAFLGFNDSFSAAPYIFNDGTSTSPLCTSPVRQCGNGSLYGGMEPAQTYFHLANRSPQAMAGGLPNSGGAHRMGEDEELFNEIHGMRETQARRMLHENGFSIAKTTRVGGTGLPSGTVSGVERRDGNRVELFISDGTAPAPAPEEPPAPTNTRPDVDSMIQDFNDSLNELAEQFGL